MKKIVLVCVLLCVAFFSFGKDKVVEKDYTPNKEALSEFLDLKLGLLLDFGVYSLFGSDYKGFHIFDGRSIMYHTQISHKEYENVAKSLDFSTDEVSSSIKQLLYFDINYVVINVKNRDGFCLFDSKYTDYDIVDYAKYGKNLLEIIVSELKKNNIKYSFEYSILDWHHSSQVQLDKDGVRYPVRINSIMNEGQKDEYMNYMKNQLKELLKYNPSSIIFNGDWVKWWTYEDALELYSFVRSISDDVLISSLGNPKWKKGLDYPVYSAPHQLKTNKRNSNFEYHYRFNMTVNPFNGERKLKKPEKFYKDFYLVFSRGGNFLMDFSLFGDWTIDNNSLESIKSISNWFYTNKKAIINSKVPDTSILFGKNLIDNHFPWGFFMQNGNTLYGFVSMDKINSVTFPKFKNGATIKKCYLIKKDGYVDLNVKELLGSYKINFNESPYNSVFVVEY